jgi:hypothetical protein
MYHPLSSTSRSPYTLNFILTNDAFKRKNYMRIIENCEVVVGKSEEKETFCVQRYIKNRSEGLDCIHLDPGRGYMWTSVRF